MCIRDTPYIVLMQMAENYCYKHSDYVVSLLPCAEGHMKEHGLADGKFVYIPNGIVKEDWEKEPANPPVYADKLGQYHRDGWFLIGYTGAHGIANGLDSFVEAGKALQGKKIKLILVGQGPERDRLLSLIHIYGPANVGKRWMKRSVAPSAAESIAKVRTALRR